MALFEVVVESKERRVYRVMAGTSKMAQDIVEGCPCPEKELPNHLDPTMGYWGVVEVRKVKRGARGGVC